MGLKQDDYNQLSSGLPVISYVRTDAYNTQFS